MKNGWLNWFGGCRFCKSRENTRLLWNKPRSMGIRVCQKCIDEKKLLQSKNWGEMRDAKG